MKHTGVNAQYKGLMGYHESHYGFMVHEGNKTALTTTFVIDDGSKPYSYTIHKGVGHQRTGVAALRGGAPLEQRAAGNDGSLPRAHLPKSKGLTGPSRVKS
jgi:hypothetical protein